MSFWCLQFFQKTNETIQLTVLRYLNWNCFRSFFGRIEDTKRTFRNQLTIKSPQTIIILYSKILDPWFHLLTCDRYSYSRKFSHFFFSFGELCRQSKNKPQCSFLLPFPANEKTRFHFKTRNRRHWKVRALFWF